MRKDWERHLYISVCTGSKGQNRKIRNECTRRGEAEDVDRGAVGGVIGDEGALEGGGGELVVRAIRRDLPDLQSPDRSRTPPPKWGRGQISKPHGNGGRGEETGLTNLDVVVCAGGGEAAGGRVEVEAEHGLLVVPVDLQRPAPHLVECWMGSAAPPIGRSSSSASPLLPSPPISLSFSRVWILGERESQRRENGGGLRAHPHLLTPLPPRSSSSTSRLLLALPE